MSTNPHGTDNLTTRDGDQERGQRGASYERYFLQLLEQAVPIVGMWARPRLPVTNNLDACLLGTGAVKDGLLIKSSSTWRELLLTTDGMFVFVISKDSDINSDEASKGRLAQTREIFLSEGQLGRRRRYCDVRRGRRIRSSTVKKLFRSPYGMWDALR